MEATGWLHQPAAGAELPTEALHPVSWNRTYLCAIVPGLRPLVSPSLLCWGGIGEPSQETHGVPSSVRQLATSDPAGPASGQQ